MTYQDSIIACDTSACCREVINIKTSSEYKVCYATMHPNLLGDSAINYSNDRAQDYNNSNAFAMELL